MQRKCLQWIPACAGMTKRAATQGRPYGISDNLGKSAESVDNMFFAVFSCNSCNSWFQCFVFLCVLCAFAVQMVFPVLPAAMFLSRSVILSKAKDLCRDASVL